MDMHAPPHPGDFIRSMYLEPLQLSERALAKSLAVSPSTLNRIMTGKSGVSPDMALRLSRALGRSPESWLALQNQFDLWAARNTVDLEAVQVVLESRPETPA
jgi:addiction module HigA family antidote